MSKSVDEQTMKSPDSSGNEKTVASLMEQEMQWLIRLQILPNKTYISTQRFINPYKTTGEFWSSVMHAGGLPILNGLCSCYYASKAVWAILKVVGNLLILRSKSALSASDEVTSYLMLATGVLLMAPIHTLTFIIEMVTRSMSSWLTGEESQDNLSKIGVMDVLSWRIKPYQQDHELPSSDYFDKRRFFSPYENVSSCFKQMAAPFGSLFKGGLNVLSEALRASFFLLECIVNLVIGKPLHAYEAFQEMQVSFSLAVSLAVMAPINALVESIAFLTGLGSTWASVFFEPEDSSANVESRI